MAVPMVGASGTVPGVTVVYHLAPAPTQLAWFLYALPFSLSESQQQLLYVLTLPDTLVPQRFWAVILNEYSVPLVRPVTVIGDTPRDAVRPPGLLVTV